LEMSDKGSTTHDESISTLLRVCHDSIPEPTSVDSVLGQEVVEVSSRGPAKLRGVRDVAPAFGEQPRDGLALVLPRDALLACHEPSSLRHAEADADRRRLV